MSESTSQNKRYRIRVPVHAELTVEAESPEAIITWLRSFTFTDACTEDCLYSVGVIRGGGLTAELWYDPALVREEIDLAQIEDCSGSVQHPSRVGE